MESRHRDPEMQRRDFLEGLTGGGLLLASQAVLESETTSKGEHEMDGDDSVQRRHRLYQLLGDLPPRERRSSAEILSKTEKDGFVLEKLVLDLNGLEPVPAYFIRPQSSTGRTPAILYNH